MTDLPMDDAPDVALDDAPLDPREQRALDAWTPLAPPAGFADRVLAARGAEAVTVAPPVRRRARWPFAAGGLVACAAAASLWLARTPDSLAAHGHLEAARRTTAHLGDRAVVVAEATAQLRWDIDDDGAADVEQTRGSVFYRVDSGRPFVVHTPAGTVRVTGTCFQIEVTPMSKKHLFASGAAGAAIAAAVVITVYEGRVVAETDAARSELVAGTRATIDPSGGAIVASNDSKAPASALASELARAVVDDASASREQLIARAGEQRVEIEKLRIRIAQLEQRATVPSSTAEEGRAWYDPSPERLAEWAKECHIRYDEPGFDRWKPLRADLGNGLGLEPGEIPAYNAAMSEVQQQWRALVRALYIETTGDTAGADVLSLDAMRGEILEKSPPEELGQVLQRLAAERAGLAAPPADLSKTSPLERLFRALSALGDQSEAAIAKRLGAERAKAIRGDGWGSRSDQSGCPRSPG